MDEEKVKVEVEENKDNHAESGEQKLKTKKGKIVKYVIYIAVLIFALVGRTLPTVDTFDLGDFGSIVPLLLQVVALMGLKWLPIFSVAGLFITTFEEKLGDFSNAFLTIVIVVAVTSFLLLLFM